MGRIDVKPGAARIVLLGALASAIGCDFLLNLNPLAGLQDGGNGDSSVVDGGSPDAGPADGSTSGCSPDGGPPAPVASLTGCVTQGPDGGRVVFVVPLEWQASAWTSTYSIERRDTNGGQSYVEIARVDGATTTFVDHVQCWNWDYDYVVIPGNACGDGGSGSVLDVYTLHLFCDGGVIPNPGSNPACCGTADGGC